MNFKGPCLEHCYKQSSASVLLIGIFSGIIIYGILYGPGTHSKNYNKNKSLYIPSL